MLSRILFTRIGVFKLIPHGVDGREIYKFGTSDSFYGCKY